VKADPQSEHLQHRQSQNCLQAKEKEKMIDESTMMRQAPMTAEHYLLRCEEILEKHWGKGAGRENPQILAAMIQACAVDFQGVALLQIREVLGNRLG
jgi:hypothetical protein